MMEYHQNPDKDPQSTNGNIQLPCRIFEKGLELFSDETEYVLRYLGFLIAINDEASELSYR